MSDIVIEKKERPMIYAQLAKVVADIGAIGKNATNDAQRFKYRSIDDVMSYVNPILGKHNICISGMEVLEHRTVNETTKSGNASLRHFVKIMYSLSAEDGSVCHYTLIGESADTGDKGVNKCYAIAYKYFLTQAFCIPIADIQDPDQTSHEFIAKKSAPPPAQRSTPPPPPNEVPRPPVNPNLQNPHVSPPVAGVTGGISKKQYDLIMGKYYSAGYTLEETNEASRALFNNSSLDQLTSREASGWIKGLLGDHPVQPKQVKEPPLVDQNTDLEIDLDSDDPFSRSE